VKMNIITYVYNPGTNEMKRWKTHSSQQCCLVRPCCLAV
jgi:hypothetical protein